MPVAITVAKKEMTRRRLGPFMRNNTRNAKRQDAKILGQVTGIQADALQTLSPGNEDLPGDPDRVGDARLEDVVGVHEQDRVVGIELRKPLERGVLVVVIHDPAVGHRPADGDAEYLSRQQRGGAGGPADVRRPGAVDGGIHVMGSPRAEVRHGPSLRGLDDPVGLRGDQGLMVDLVQDRRVVVA